jgi:G:T/U-mismatch repair DNA glycosylase
MAIIQHKFLEHKINPKIETLIIGTFNPSTPNNNAEFFYGRSRNFLWELLPTAFEQNSLKSASKQQKVDFINKYKIDFIDLIKEVDVEQGQEANYDDTYIDPKVISWIEINELEKLKNLKRVCVTRKTFSGVPNIKKHVDEIEKYCKDKEIKFQKIVSPARFYSQSKQEEWTNFLLK